MIYENGNLTGKFCDGIDPIEQNLGRIFLKCANDGKPFTLRRGAFNVNKNLISANNLYLREHNLQIIDFPMPRNPVSISEPELIKHYFDTSNKSHVISRSLQTLERYTDLYSEDEISEFFQEMAIFIQKNDLGKFSLSNGRWVKIFDMLLEPGPWNVIIEPLLNKIQVVDFEASKLEDFWNDDITQYSLVIEKYPNIAIEVYENQDERLSLILLESIALDMADSFEKMFHYGTKRQQGWTRNHSVFQELRDDDIPEGTAEELRKITSWSELIMMVMAGRPTNEWFKHKAIRYRHKRTHQRRIH